MKKSILLILAVLMLGVMGCDRQPDMVVDNSTLPNGASLAKGGPLPVDYNTYPLNFVLYPFSVDAPAVSVTTNCGVTYYDWFAGQTNDVGTVAVYNDGTNLYIEVFSNVGINELHGWVGTDQLQIPRNQNGGREAPGQLGWQIQFNPAVNTYLWTIPLANIVGLYNTDGTIACDKPIYWILHGALTNGETVYGGNFGVNVAENGSWWYYGVYTYKCCQPPPPPDGTYQTAYVYPGAGSSFGRVFTTGTKSNPDGFVSWNLTKNRWGWGFQPVTNGTYDIIAGAGLNLVTNGRKVGEATLTYDVLGNTTTVSITMSSGFSIAELHIYAGTVAPNTIAPGQYPYKSYFGDEPLDYATTFNGTFAGNVLVVHMSAYGQF